MSKVKVLVKEEVKRCSFCRTDKRRVYKVSGLCKLCGEVLLTCGKGRLFAGNN